MTPEESEADQVAMHLLAALEEDGKAEEPFSESSGASSDPQADRNCLQLLQQVLARRPAAEAPAPTPGLPFTRLGRFRIVRELGRGTFGMVFLALDPELRREVALKVPRPEALITPELRERFVREARAAAGLDHPNLVAVYEAGTVGPICYLASAYCPGITLAGWLKQRAQSVPVRLAAELVATLAAAVHHAHGRGVVHRDLKPANVLLQTTHDDREPETETKTPSLYFTPKITDFGLAKLTRDAGVGPATTSEGQTVSGAIVGTPYYMAPEQAGGHNKEVGPAADVYSLGAILYELLTGSPPFRGETTLDTLEQVRTSPPVLPSRVRPKLPRDLETICLKCLEKSPWKRYPSAAALANDLRAFLAGAPIQARPVRFWERGLKWAQRRPAVALLVLVSCSAALLATRSNLGLLLAVGSVALVALLSVTLHYTARLHQAQADLQREQAASDQLRQQADDHLQQTVRALEEAVGRGIHDEQLKMRSAERVRELLQSLIGLQQRLASQMAEDPCTQAARGWTFARLAQLSLESGSEQDSLRLYDEALARLRSVARDHPDVSDYRAMLARALSRQAALWTRTGQPKSAEYAFREALGLQHQLVQDHPTVPEYQVDLADSLTNLGNLFLALRQPKAAEEAYGSALKSLRQLPPSRLAAPKHQVSLANLHTNLGHAYAKQGRLKEVEAAHREAARILDQVNRDPRPGMEVPYRLAVTYQNLGRVYRKTRRFQAAEVVLERSLQLLEQLVQDDPNRNPSDGRTSESPG
jgi:serine/threonine-protein kinase